MTAREREMDKLLRLVYLTSPHTPKCENHWKKDECICFIKPIGDLLYPRDGICIKERDPPHDSNS